ncbi:serine/threonine protein kinase [Rhodoferax sp.]|uniref:serine/threonine protein kinase n=1 Tax=Rhodoferax sp. TaxID=50421 RepID=UPI00374D27FA
MTDSAPLTAAPRVLHSDALPSGTRLAEFELIRLLGVGGFGMVYEAYDHSLHRSVAIKEYMPSALAGRTGGVSVFIRSSVDTPSYQAGLQSFVAEARLLAQFDHPSLVKVFRFWEANNTAYMVMPLYTGMTLKQARSQMRHPPPEAWLRQVLWSMLEALKLLHAQDTVHRDVSPDNIFLQDSGPPVLLDLGSARQAIGDLGRRHTAVLKVNYAPIEQYADARDMAQGAWSDLYSLAAVVHGCLANDLPLPATFRVLRDRMPGMQQVAELAQAEHGRAYSPEFVETLDRSLAIRPEERPQSVADFAASLDLHTPLDMAHFDWRAEMGADWQLSVDEQALRARPGMLDLAELPTEFLYPPRKSTELLALPAPVVDVRPRRPRALALLASVLLIAGLGLANWWGTRTESPEVVATQQAAPAELPVPETPVKVEVVAEPAAPVAAAPKLVKRASVVHAKSSHAEAVAPPAVPEPSPAQLAAQYRANKLSSPTVELCIESNFLTRPMCMYRECKKPEFAELPACVENTQRLLANQQSRH